MSVVEAPRMPPKGLVTYRRRSLAVGLHWSQADAEQLVPEAQRLAGQFGSKLYCIRGRPHRDFAVADARRGHRPGLIAAATIAAANRPGSWAAIVEVPEGYWYVALLDNALVGSCDLLFSSLHDAAAYLQAQRAVGQWET